jgi:hypothetical protein
MYIWRIFTANRLGGFSTHLTGHKITNCVFKGSWKREKWGVGKESNVTIWCRTVAMDVYLQFEHAVLE